jgi:hypothetical protein
MGFESLAIIELRNEWGAALGAFVSPRHLIAAPDLRTVAELLAESMTRREETDPAATRLQLASVERLSDAEVDSALELLFGKPDDTLYRAHHER